MRKWMKRILLLAMLAGITAGAVTAQGAQLQLVKEDGITYVCNQKGKIVKNQPVCPVKSGKKVVYYAADKKGVARRWTGVSALAARQLDSLKAGKKKSTANLKKAFKWSAGLPYRNNTVNKKGSAAAKYYGNYGFKSKSGDCNTVAYTFYWMAKVLGYAPKAIQGYVPDGSVSNLKPHAWVIIRMSNKDYYFDPDLNRSRAGTFVNTQKGRIKLSADAGFKFLYRTPGTYQYHDANKKPMG